MESVQEFLHKHPKVHNLALIQCTSPFIQTTYLKEAFNLFKYSDCVFAAVRSWKLRWIVEIETNKVKPINFNVMKRPRRQDWKGELLETGMFYFTRFELLERKIFQNEK